MTRLITILAAIAFVASQVALLTKGYGAFVVATLTILGVGYVAGAIVGLCVACMVWPPVRRDRRP
jgi:hypothetical protein